MAGLKEYRVKGLPDPVSHYTDAVKAGNTVYMSGLASVDAKGAVIAKGDPAGQARQTFRNLGLVLDAVGATPNDVVKVTLYLTNVEHRLLINPVRKEFFGDHRPASTLVEISRLAYDDLLIEVDAIAVTE